MPNSENVTTKFKVDISDLKSNIAEANRQLKTAQAEMKNATAGMEKGEKTVDSLSAQIAAQSKIVEAEEKKLAALKSEMERYNARIKEGDRVIADLTEKHRKAAAAYGAESAEAKKYEKQLQDAQKAQERNKTAAENLNVQIINQDTKVKEAAASVNRYKTQLTELESGEKKTAEATKDLGDTAKDTTDGGLDAFAVALGNLAANVITAVIDKLGEMAQAAINAFEDFDTGRDAVIKATGAVGEQADLLTKSYGEVAKKVPGDLAAVGETLGEINTRFGFTGSELEECTEKFMKFADIAGVDAKTSVQTVSKAMAGAGVSAEDYADFLDKIAIAAQASGISADKLAENLTRYGAQMRALGFDTDTSIAAFSQWEKAGVNVETALAGMKKAVGEWSKEAIDAKVAFQETVDQIASAPDDISAAQKAVEAFGSKAGPEFADAIRSGRFEFSDFLQTVENSNGTVENTFNETQSALDRFRLKLQEIKVTVGEGVSGFFETFSPQIEGLLDSLGGLIPIFSDVVNGADGAADALGSKISEIVFNIGDQIAGALPTLLKVGTSIVTALTSAVVAGLPEVLPLLTPALADIIDSIGKMLPQLVSGAADVLPILVSQLIDSADVILDALVDVLEQVFNSLPDVIPKLMTSLPTLISKLGEFILKNLPMLLNALTNVITVIVQQLPTILIGAINTIKQNAGILGSIVTAVVMAVPTLIRELSPVLFDVVLQLAAAVIRAIPTALAAIGRFLQSLFSHLWEEYILPELTALVQYLNEWMPELGRIIVDFWSSLLVESLENSKQTFRRIGAAFTGAIDGIKNGVKSLPEFFKKKFTEAYTNVKNVFSKIGNFFGGIWDTIKGKFSGIGTKVGEVVGGAFKTAINAVISTVENGLNFIPNAINGALDLINDLPGVNIPELATFQLPRLMAKGGIAQRPVNAIVGEAGAEAVIPLKQGIPQLAAAIASSLQASGIGLSQQTVNNYTYNFDQTNNSPKALSRWEIYRQTKNLLSYVQG